jgi:hypothetical protein
MQAPAAAPAPAAKGNVPLPRPRPKSIIGSALSPPAYAEGPLPSPTSIQANSPLDLTRLR